jgi:excisionase family DNA binding protein
MELVDQDQERDRSLVPLNEVTAVGISRSHIYELVAAQKLRRIKIGRRAFITRESLNRYLDELFAQ